jgi:hypothetical protein
MSFFAVAQSPSVVAASSSAPVVAAVVIGVIVVVYVGGTIVARRKGYGIGGNTIVRCRKGHLFTTIWVPGVSLKSIRLGAARVQHCPVGHHWSLVIPVKGSDLTEEDKVSAEAHHDVRIP